MTNHPVTSHEAKRALRLTLIASLAILMPSVAAAQATVYEVIHSFKGKPDGAQPEASVVIAKSGALYGTTYRGGTAGSGTVFEMAKPTGGSWQESILYSFSQPNGEYPTANVVFGSTGALFGTTATGPVASGPTSNGTIFQLAPPPVSGGAWTMTYLYTFGGSAGTNPFGAVLIGPGGTLYTTTEGYVIPGGTAVALAPPTEPGGTWTASVIYSFPQPGDVAGSNPFAGLVSEGGSLYGTNYYGGAVCGAEGCGVVYELTPPATQGGPWTETTIHTFTGEPSDGGSPLDALTVGPGGVLYGTTYFGGIGSSTQCYTNGPGCGTVFQLTPPTAPGGTWTESVLYSFTGENGDGALPMASVVIGKNGVIYGTTAYGGSATTGSPCSSGGATGCGTAFQLTPPTTPGGPWTETILHSFTGQNGDGSIPLAGLALSSTGVLYGTTSAGGTAGNGTVFAIVP
jgi:uncharacterized repeat protein (TIGR03803 family)